MQFDGTGESGPQEKKNDKINSDKNVYANFILKNIKLTNTKLKICRENHGPPSPVSHDIKTILS